MRIYNFYSGPATLPIEVLEELSQNIVNYNNSGLSIVETSHRSDEYLELHRSVIRKLAELIGINDNYEILLLGGGATLQFSMVPMNLMTGSRCADFVDSGAWSAKAIADADKFGNTKVIWSQESSGKDLQTLPSPTQLHINKDSSYLYITSNETIGGIQWQDYPQCEIPLVADMSSDILSREIPLSNFGLIFACTQKNIGVSGLTVVIIRKDLLERSSSSLSSYLNYQLHAKSGSLYNTPPVFAVWATSLVLDWIKARGGPSAMHSLSMRKSQMIYSVIDESEGFYASPVDPQFRSKMNIVFQISNSALEDRFLKEAREANMIGLQGHRSVGGMRASLYNAMPDEGARQLAEFMRSFAKRY